MRRITNQRNGYTNKMKQKWSQRLKNLTTGDAASQAGTKLKRRLRESQSILLQFIDSPLQALPQKSAAITHSSEIIAKGSRMIRPSWNLAQKVSMRWNKRNSTPPRRLRNRKTQNWHSQLVVVNSCLTRITSRMVGLKKMIPSAEPSC